MIKGVIFDLDNTLYDDRIYIYEMFKIFAKRYEISFEKMKEIFTDEMRLKSIDIFGDILKRLNIYSKKAHDEMFEIYENLDCLLSLNDDSVEILEFLQNRGVKMAIVTNGVVGVQKNKIKVLNVKKYIKNIVYAREFGKECEKPHPKPFLKAVEMLNLNPDEVIFIGDNPLTDIKGAKSAGILAYRLLNGHMALFDCDECNNIKSLLEVKNLIG
ncbi:HAD family hydrolase [Campylobacter sputorum]|uniref:HAD family hydrolase n=1 Tax=Campylobacter sputorum TaxID=206 RepID=UPI00053BEE08|nr:HAD family hydrolase [Campylobacter sputorum]